MKDARATALLPDGSVAPAATEPPAGALSPVAGAGAGAGALAAATSAESGGAARVVPLGHGRSLEIAEEGAEERLQVRAAEGQILLSIRLTSEGPVLSLEGVSLEISAAKALSLGCETLRIQAAQDASIEVGGSLREQVRGSVVREAGRSARVTAAEVTVEASPGGVAIRANDDVDLVGERVRLNSEDPPMPLTREEFLERQALVRSRPEPAALMIPPDAALGGAGRGTPSSG
ncbi:hypothetical protein [Chondromyces apiculatus]|uniref:hypothetical protein n=1 Tax=Chondromyces apiculatus TaxID=51 RepID=UPI0012DEDC1C|nr:hypothetical protein [Chondromyces apiculatus]